ncbi:MAG: regulatory protein RecX [Bacteroidota bacterium]
MQPKRFTPDQARLKIQAYCAYQERSHREVREKLYSYGLFKDDVDQLTVELLDQNFLNEERFARAYVSGKFRIKKWGRRKIELHLKEKGVSAYCIKQGFKEIDPEEYSKTMMELIAYKLRTVAAKNDFERHAKTAAYIVGRGFESELVWEQIHQLRVKN